MDDMPDGTGTGIENYFAIMERACNDSISQSIPSGEFCHGGTDMATCWPHTPVGEFANESCPETEAQTAQRFCELNGRWKMNEDQQKIWANYSACINANPTTNNTEVGPSDTSRMSVVYNVGYSFSLVTLFLAMCVFIYFKRLHCTRNFIHLHLFASFFFRAVMIFIKDAVLKSETGVGDVKSLLARVHESSANSVMNEFYTQTKSGNLIACKVVVTLYHYFAATNYFWIVVEGLYLHCLIFVTFFAEKKYLTSFTLTGWGLPLLFVIPWAIVKELEPSSSLNRCWNGEDNDYRWIYNAPIIAANLVNFFLFINILRVLWYKLRYSVCNQPEIGNQYKKLAKSTLVLIPMFGVHAIIFRGIPDSITQGPMWKIRMYWELFFDSFQGFFVAIIYCFINGEVLAELKRTWRLFQTTFQIQRTQRQSTRSTNTIMTNFSSSTAPVAPRPSICPSTSPFNNRGYNQSDEEENAEDFILKGSKNNEQQLNDLKNANKETQFSDDKIPVLEKEPLLLKPDPTRVSTPTDKLMENSTIEIEGHITTAIPNEYTTRNELQRKEKNHKTKTDENSLASPVEVKPNHFNGRRSSDDSGINSLVTSSMNRRSSNLESISCSESIGEVLDNELVHNVPSP